MKEKQTTLIPKVKKPPVKRIKNLRNKEKKELRSWWKKYKSGMVQFDDIPPRFQKLLLRYYPIEVKNGDNH
jgi:hypothetical protein